MSVHVLPCVAASFAYLGPVSLSWFALLKLDFFTSAMHLLYALVRKSSFSKTKGFVKPAPVAVIIKLASALRRCVMLYVHGINTCSCIVS